MEYRDLDIFVFADAIFCLLGKREVLETRKIARQERTYESVEMHGKLLGGEVKVSITFDGVNL